VQQSQWGKRKKFQWPPPPKVRTGRRVADRRRRRGRRREELPGGAHQKRNTAIWKDGKLEKTQVRNTKEHTDCVGVRLLTRCKHRGLLELRIFSNQRRSIFLLTGSKFRGLFLLRIFSNQATVNIPSFLPSPDQRVELFSPVLGGSLLFSRTWNRRGKGGKKG
jgi:hypothetical protein